MLAEVVHRASGATTTTWPIAISASEGRKPMKVKYMSAASPKASMGRISGDMKNVSSARTHVPDRRGGATAAGRAQEPRSPNASRTPATQICERSAPRALCENELVPDELQYPQDQPQADKPLPPHDEPRYERGDGDRERHDPPHPADGQAEAHCHADEPSPLRR